MYQEPLLRPVSRLLSNTGNIWSFLPRMRGLGGKGEISYGIKKEGEGWVRCGVKRWCLSVPRFLWRPAERPGWSSGMQPPALGSRVLMPRTGLTHNCYNPLREKCTNVFLLFFICFLLPMSVASSRSWEDALPDLPFPCNGIKPIPVAHLECILNLRCPCLCCMVAMVANHVP